jgi:predicted RNase H-like HicB family nuclease
MMISQIKIVMEYNDNGYLLYADNYCGAFTRGRTKEEALHKFPDEIRQYVRWAGNGRNEIKGDFEFIIVQEKKSDLQICDADSEVIFETEQLPLDKGNFEKLKELVIKSAKDFQTLYDSIPDKKASTLGVKKTFYGTVPRTADEMYTHTNNVTSYYVGEIGAGLENCNDIVKNRIHAMECIEKLPNYLDNMVVVGSYNEKWSLRKVLRRFIWHDRIHAKAMYRMAIKSWDKAVIKNPFYFQ